MPGVQPFGTVVVAAAIAVTAKVQLPNTPARTVFLRSDKTNTVPIWVGDSTVSTTGTGNVLMDLQPGEGVFIDLNNLNLLYVAASSSSKLYASALK